MIVLRSKYFATALTTGVGNAKVKSEIEVIDCSPEVLKCAVDFMYGIPIPEDFADIKGLLHQADLFMMEDLKHAAGLHMAKTLSLNTIKELVALGERYREVKLQESCGDFILAHIEEMQEEMISELALPPIARQVIQAFKVMKKESKEKIEKVEGDAEEKILFAEELRTHISDIGAKVLGIFKTDQFKKRSDFPSSLGVDEYKAYVKGHIGADMLVRCCKAFYTGLYSEEVATVGDIGRVVSVDLTGVQVKWHNGKTTNGKKDCFANLELLTHPLKTTFLA